MRGMCRALARRNAWGPSRDERGFISLFLRPAKEKGDVMARSILLPASMALAVLLACSAMLVGCGQARAPIENQEKKEGVEQAREQTTQRPEAAQPEPAPVQKSEPPATIPGLSAGESVSIFEENGLECVPHVPQEGSALLYTCTSADNQDLDLLYEGKIAGTRPQRVHKAWKRG